MYYIGKILIFRFSALCICFTKDLQSHQMGENEENCTMQ